MKARLLVFVSVAIWVTALGWMSAAPGDQDDWGNIPAAEAARVAQGYAIAPVHLNLAGRNPVLVGLGSYLVNAVGGCNDCHTNPPYKFGGDPSLGQPKRVNRKHYLAGGTAFGPFVSRNLTPGGHPFLPEDGHTFAQFLDIIRNGTNDDFDPSMPVVPPNLPLLQVMPWPVYQNMTNRDLQAIYEFLRAIPHAEPCASVTAVGPMSPPPDDPSCAVFSPDAP
jgi:hypothetical protein